MVNPTDTKISESFPHKTLPPIAGQPTYEAIKELHLKLNEDAVKVHSNLGNGLLGYLGVTVTPAICNTLSAQPFVIPPNPGTAPFFTDNATGPQMPNIREVFTEESIAFKKYVNVCNPISALILEVIGPVYLATLGLPYVGIGTRTPLESMAHLYTNYAKITPADLDGNNRTMKQLCDVNQPIEVLYQQIEDAIEFAAAGQTPYSPKPILDVAYQLIFCTGIFSNDCKIWKRQPAAYKTWPQFKVDFAVAHQEYSEALDVTPAASGFHAEEATDQQETIEAIANLATATAEDCKAVANLTGTNATLTKELATTDGKLVTALTLVTTLTKQNADLCAGSSHRIADNRTPERKHYCWTCGYRCEHSSWLCPNPATGHKTRAKAADTMNGSIKNKPN
jgi:rubrerythrin